ncbi:MAG: hypothetical protein V7K25_06710 [Nostoc sp.]
MLKRTELKWIRGEGLDPVLIRQQDHRIRGYTGFHPQRRTKVKVKV